MNSYCTACDLRSGIAAPSNTPRADAIRRYRTRPVPSNNDSEERDPPQLVAPLLRHLSSRVHPRERLHRLIPLPLRSNAAPDRYTVLTRPRDHHHHLCVETLSLSAFSFPPTYQPETSRRSPTFRVSVYRTHTHTHTHSKDEKHNNNNNAIDPCRSSPSIKSPTAIHTL